MNTAPKVILTRVGVARTPIRLSRVVVAGIHNHHLNGRAACNAVVVSINARGHELIADTATGTAAGLAS